MNGDAKQPLSITPYNYLLFINTTFSVTEAIHAELCYAESLLLKSMLTFIEDESLVNFIKGGIKIRSCFNSYK